MSLCFPLCQLAPSFLLLLLLLPKISSSSDCSDDPRYVAKCPGWSRVCSLLPAFMDVFCPRTCNTCSKCACEDQATFAVRCNEWKHHCTGGQWKDFVVSRCPSTCNACECSEGFIEGSGVLSSPNHPGRYPNNYDKTASIEVEKGETISIEFTAFEVEKSRTCAYDHLTILEGDGTTLMSKTCGYSLPPPLTSKSNKVEVIFKTDSSVTKSGFKLNWSAVKPACKCGIEKPHQRIVGGVESQSGKYPWMAALFDSSDSSKPRWKACGGTLIASNWVVTAAHCMWRYNIDESKLVKHTKDDLDIVLGVLNISSTDNSTDKNRKKVKLQIDPLFHPESSQDKPDPQKGHDIALLKLSEDVDFEIYTPACLPSDGADYTGQTGSVYGWGSLQSCPKNIPDILREVEVDVISDADCDAQSSNSVTFTDTNGECGTGFFSYEGMISDDMLCAGAPGKDACQGDSGGPFTVKETTTEKHELVGVVSWGAGCAADGLSGVYVDVAKMRGWIDSTIEENGGATFCH